jgi:hypothetical protein
MKTMHCTEFEALACDYADGLLPAAERTAAESHLGQCAACRELAEEQASLKAFLEGVPEVEAPPELITRLIQDSPMHQDARKRAKRGWLRRTLAPLLDPVLQPRFAMGMAMTILSFSMLGKFAAPVRQLKPSDLDPVKVWAVVEDKAHRTWDRAAKYYENLRLVWEIQTRLAEIQQDENTSSAQPPTGEEAAPVSTGNEDQKRRGMQK